MQASSVQNTNDLNVLSDEKRNRWITKRRDAGLFSPDLQVLITTQARYFLGNSLSCCFQKNLATINHKSSESQEDTQN